VIEEMIGEKAEFMVREAIATDVSQIFALIQALAKYENLENQVKGTEAALSEHLFGDRPCVEAIVASHLDKKKILGFALFFANYSTFLTQPGIYLEDLFVLPEYRNQGIGKSLLTQLAKIAIARNCGRLEWSVLDWNQSAISFYQNMGAEVLPDWRICRVSKAAMTKIATALD
jgi:GNAT superfamily N-acetyltransferase